MTEPLRTLIASDWRDYALLDSGDGWKRERFGEYVFARPEPQALWRPKAPVESWNVDARFSPAAQEDEDQGRWRFSRPLPESWRLSHGGLSFFARATPFRHLGFFPEQSVHWLWAQALMRQAGDGANVLNLFGYTGLASLALAAAGCRVTHVDASKKAIRYARENQTASGLENSPIRWIVDDALAFAQREVRRGVRYDGIILDPPKHGRGPNGEIWKLEESLPALLELLPDLLVAPGERPAFVIATLYAVRLSPLALARALEQRVAELGGGVEAGEMTLAEEKTGRLLPTAIFARWLRPPKRT